MAAKASGAGGRKSETNASGIEDKFDLQIGGEPSLGPQQGPHLPLARGEIIAFRVEMTFKTEETTPTYRVIVKYQGNEGEDRVIENATQALNPPPHPKSLERNDVMRDVYDSIKKYYVASYRSKSNIVSTPVYAFVCMVKKYIRRQEHRLQTLIQGELWPSVQTMLKPYNLKSTDQAREAARQLSLLLDDYASTFFVPILDSMRKDVGAENEDLWTRDTIFHYDRWLRSRNPFGCYVRYHFCKDIMRYHLNRFKKLYTMATHVQSSMQTLEPETSKKKKPKGQKKQFRLDSMRNNIDFAGKKGFVDREILAYTKYIQKIVTTYEKGGEDGAPLPPDVRQSSGGAKQAAIEATLSLEVVPAQAPHFHLCLNSRYFMECVKEQKIPDALEAIKIAHVRRYRAENVRNNRRRVFQGEEGRTSFSFAKMKEKEARESRSNVEEAWEFDRSQAKFLSEQVLAEKTIDDRLTYLQKQHKQLKDAIAKLKKPKVQVEPAEAAEAAKKVEGEGSAAVPESAPKLKSSSDGAGGESKQQRATDTGEEHVELIGLDDVDLGDHADSEDVKKMVKALQKLLERIEKDENKLGKFKDRPNKLATATQKLNNKKARFLKTKAELRELLRKLNESSEE